MIDRSTLSEGDAYLLDRHADYSKTRRDQLRAMNRCICGPLHDGPSKRCRVVHGPVVQGGRCQRCLEIKNR